MNLLSPHPLGRFAGLLLVSAVIAGCAKEPPGCAEASTLELAQGAFWKTFNQLAETKGESIESANRVKELFSVNFEAARVVTKNPEASQVMCAAELRVKMGAEFSKIAHKNLRRESVDSISYSSQITADGKQHHVQLSEHDELLQYVWNILELHHFSRVLESGVLNQAPEHPNMPSSATAAPNESNKVETAADIADKAQAEFQAADVALNSAYQAARTKLSDAQKTALRDEQRDWIQRRDKTCVTEEVAIATSAIALEQIGCKTKLTQARTKELASR